MQQGRRLLDSRGEGYRKATDLFVESRGAMCDTGTGLSPEGSRLLQLVRMPAALVLLRIKALKKIDTSSLNRCRLKSG
jgi:hypothetical protein